MRPEVEIMYELEFITPRGNVSEIFSITYDKEMYEDEADSINFTVVHFRTEEMKFNGVVSRHRSNIMPIPDGASFLLYVKAIEHRIELTIQLL